MTVRDTMLDKLLDDAARRGLTVRHDDGTVDVTRELVAELAPRLGLSARNARRMLRAANHRRRTASSTPQGG